MTAIELISRLVKSGQVETAKIAAEQIGNEEARNQALALIQISQLTCREFIAQMADETTGSPKQRFLFVKIAEILYDESPFSLDSKVLEKADLSFGEQAVYDYLCRISPKIRELIRTIE